MSTISIRQLYKVLLRFNVVLCVRMIKIHHKFCKQGKFQRKSRFFLKKKNTVTFQEVRIGLCLNFWRKSSGVCCHKVSLFLVNQSLKNNTVILRNFHKMDSTLCFCTSEEKQKRFLWVNYFVKGNRNQFVCVSSHLWKFRRTRKLSGYHSISSTRAPVTSRKSRKLTSSDRKFKLL